MELRDRLEAYRVYLTEYAKRTEATPNTNFITTDLEQLLAKVGAKVTQKVIQDDIQVLMIDNITPEIMEMTFGSDPAWKLQIQAACRVIESLQILLRGVYRQNTR